MPPAASSQRLYLRPTPTRARSQRSKAVRLKVSIGDNANFSTVHGNQYNNYTIQQKKAARFIVGTEEEEAEYEQFREVLRSDVIAVRNVDITPIRRFDEELHDWVECGQQMMVAVQVKIGGVITDCMAVSYRGEGAKERWKEDFQRFSGARNAENVQLVAINMSRIPMLILTGDLVPAAHLMDQAGTVGQMYLRGLELQMSCWQDDSLWMDTSRGAFCCGPEGPGVSRGLEMELKKLSLDAKLLREDTLIRYLASRDQDLENLDELSSTECYHASQMSVERPIVISTLTNTILAVGSGDWKEDEDSGLGEKEVLSDGMTRFTLKYHRRRLKLKLELTWDEYSRAWTTQAPSIFHAHNIPLEGDMHPYRLVIPRKLNVMQSRSRAKRRRRQNCPPIYLFLTTPTFWSFDPNAQTSISDKLCHYLGLPPKLSLECDEYSWPTDVYKLLPAYQIARGFDPTTADFARHNGYHPIFEIVDIALSGRFEEVNDSEIPESSPCPPTPREASAHEQELEDFSLGFLFGDIQLKASASTARTSRTNPPLRRGPPRTFSTKGAESADSPKKLRVAAFQATRQTLSALKTVSVFSRVSRLSAVSAEPRSSTTATQSTNLSSRKTSPLRSTLSAGSNSSIVKNGTKEAPRLREGVAANKDRAVDMRRDRAGTGMATNSSQKETNTRKTRSIPSRESPVIPTKTPTPSGPAARTKTLSSTSNLTAPTPGAIGMRRSGVAPSVAKKRALKPRAGSAGARTGTEAASNVTQLHRPNQAATSASTTPRPAIPKHASSNARAAAVSRAQPPSTRLAGITGSSQATTSRSRLVRSPPAQEGVTKRRLVGSSGIEERSRTLARTSKEESPNVPRPVATTSSRRSITRPPLRWR